jgi:hypothetical protein
MLFRGHPPWVRHPRPLAKLPWASTLIIVWVIANDLLMANDLDDLDGAEGGPQPAEGRELVIVDLGHTKYDAAIIAGAWGPPPSRRDPRRHLPLTMS